MSVNGIESNGQFTNTPDVYGQANYGVTLGSSVPGKNLVLVGEYPYLEPFKPKRYSSQSALEAAMPGDLGLLQRSDIIFNPANDERVPGGPAEVWLCNVRPTTQASLDILDTDDVATISLGAKVWGPRGNQTFVTVTETDDVFAVSITREGMPAEAFTGIKGSALFTLEYADTVFGTVVADYAPGGNFQIAASKTGLAIGTRSFDTPISGTITITPSEVPGVGNSFTAVVTSLDADGETQTETLTWAAGVSTPKTVTKTMIRLVQIVFSEVLTDAPTFTVAGNIFDGSEDDYPTVASLTAEFASDDYDGILTVTSVSPLAGQIAITQVDPVDTVDLTSPVTFSNVKGALVAALAPSQLVTATALASGGAPVALATTRLLGGTAPATQLPDWDTAFNACRLVPGRIFWADSELATVHAKLKSHANFMAGPGVYDCNGWVGAAANETKDQIFTRSQTLGSRSLSLVCQEIQRTGPLGNLVWLSPKFLALLGAAVQAGTREAVTAKVPNIANFRQHPSWSPENDRTEFHNNRVTILGVGISNGASEVRFLRALTTYWGSSDPCRTDVRPVESISELMIFARPVFKPTIGGNTTAPVRVIENVWKAVLQRAKDLGIIGDFDEKSAKAVRIGNVTTLRAKVVPVFSNDFVDIQVGVVPSLTGTGFQLQIAA